MNYPLWQIPAGGLLVAGVAIVHVFLSHFAIGGGLFLVLAERRARKGDDNALLAFVRSLSRAFVLLTLVLGALTGVGIWFTIGLVNPQATSALIQTFVWVWAIEWTLFFVEIAAALVYYYGWDRLDARRHLIVGWIYFGAAWLSLAAINGILSFMMTSGAWRETGRLLDAFFNPTYFATTAMRSVAAAGLAGLYALFALACTEDGSAKARIARWIGSRWVLPAALLLPATLLWFLADAARAGVPVAETLGARSGAAAALLRAIFDTGVVAGHPVVRRAALAALVAAGLLGVGAVLLTTLRVRRFGRLEAAALLLLGFVAMGSGEWVREGLRKPYVIDRLLFVNGVWAGIPARATREFSIEALRSQGVLASTVWAHAAAFRPGDPTFEALDPQARRAVEREAGGEVFRLLCSACHTETGHLGIRRLVAGKSVEALTRTIDGLASPVSAAGSPTTWDDPNARLATWLGRRMPPFAGTAAEKRALAVFLAGLDGRLETGPAAPAVPGGAAVFESHCAACHADDAPWPIGPRLRGRDRGALYSLIGRLPQVRPEMPPFEGSDGERRALAEYLAGLSGGGAQR